MSDTTSVLVVLHPAGGPNPEPVTAANLADHQPDPAAAAAAQAWFAQQGYEVGPLVGTSFSITGPAAALSAFAMDALPSDVAPAVQAVTASTPLDFGPGNP